MARYTPEHAADTVMYINKVYVCCNLITVYLVGFLKTVKKHNHNSKY